MNPKNPISLAGTIFFLLLSYFSHAQSFGTFASAGSINYNQNDYNGTGISRNVFDNANPAVFTLGGFPLLNNWDLADDRIALANDHTFFAPTLSSSNPTTCNGTDGSVTINGLTPGTSYDINYTDDDIAVGPVTIIANGAGQAIINGLNAGVYAGFTITENGNTTNLFSGVILSNPIIVPSFTAIPPFCSGTTAPILPTTSNNGLTGTWSPATVSNTASGSYTFTPDAGQCGLSVTINITVTPRTTPTFSFATNICDGATAPVLPSTSDNGVNGTWSPSTVSNTASGSYTFTPDPGVCANPVTINVTVTPNVTPTFSFATSICEGATAPMLPSTSNNGVNGTWSPSTVSNTASGSYTFTPTAGQCALPVTVNVTVTPNVTPSFSFATTICNGATAPALPSTSDNGVNGTWSPATVSNTASGSYTFTPTAGLCALPVTINVTVTPNTTPAFSFVTTICSGATAPLLPTTSDNGVTGTWSPATVSNTASGSYTFTPTAGLCALPVTVNVTVTPNVTPSFSFTTSICEGATAPMLPSASNNGVNGTWSPSTVSNTASGSYTFTPTAGQCALPATINVTVNPILTPTFSFGTTLSICNGATAPTLPATSTNNITGTWSPATISNTTSGTYTFTPNAGQCGTTATLDVTVVANTIPTFSFGTTLSICSGGTVPALPTTSDNSVNGTWSPSTVSNTASGTYTFTPAGGVCATTQTFTVTVNPIVTPTFSFGTTASICVGATVPTLTTTSANNITGTWLPATVDNVTTGTTIYTFTPTAGQCAVAQTYTVQVNTVPTVTVPANITVNDGTVIPATNFTIAPASATVIWTNSNTAIGLAASGNGNVVPQFTATNPGNTDITATITVTPRNNGCVGTPRTYTITVKALDKGVFVPNVFSPNNDGKNDKVMIYGNYINKVEMRIFNQWGQQVAFLNSKTQGWDGTHKGKPQPVGVYVYALRAEMTDGRTVDLKGSITLVR